MIPFRKLTCLSFLLLAVVGCGDAPQRDQPGDTVNDREEGGVSKQASASDRLAGTFVSDRTATLDYLQSTGQFTADQLNSISNSLGNIEITFEGGMRKIVIGEEVAEQKFTVIEEGSNHVVIECHWSRVGQALMSEKSDIKRIEFVNDGIWVSTNGIENFKEKFVKKD